MALTRAFAVQRPRFRSRSTRPKPIRSTTRFPHGSSNWSWVHSENIPAASTAMSAIPWRGPKGVRSTMTAEHAKLENGQDILELGCGWGSLSLWMARRYPDARVTSMSNSASQREFILRQADAADLLQPLGDHHRHERIRPPRRIRPHRLRRDVRAYGQLAIAAESACAPRYVPAACYSCVSSLTNPARTGFRPRTARTGLRSTSSPAASCRATELIRQFGDLFSVDAEWQWNGGHYARTAHDWLANYDRHRAGDP